MAIDQQKIKYDYFTFDGAISKAEFQRSFIILFIISFVVNLIAFSMISSGIFYILVTIIRIILAIAMFSITIRRLRDLGHSPWVSLLMLLPIIHPFFAVVNLALIIYLLIAKRKTII